MNSTKLKVPFGLNSDNRIIHINDVEKGKGCNCICPSCRISLIAVKGKIKQPHFRHDHTCECENGFESAVHLAAKQIIMEKKQIKLPDYNCIVTKYDSKGRKHTEQDVYKISKEINFDRVQDECDLHGMRADLLAQKGEQQLIIEIFFRHQVDDQKLEKVKNANLSAIEIDLSDLTAEDIKNWDTFWLLMNDPQRIRWLYNDRLYPKMSPALEEKLKIDIQEQENSYGQHDKDVKKEINRALAVLKAMPDKLEVIKANHRNNAKNHWAMELCLKVMQISWSNLPDFVNVDVPDGDWIFTCDRRVWQTVIYKYFLWVNREQVRKESFSLREVDTTVRGKCQPPYSIQVISKYDKDNGFLKEYSHLIPVDAPSTIKTISSYLDHLCKLGILEKTKKLSDSDLKDCWFCVLNKNDIEEGIQK